MGCYYHEFNCLLAEYPSQIEALKAKQTIDKIKFF